MKSLAPLTHLLEEKKGCWSQTCSLVFMFQQFSALTHLLICAGRFWALVCFCFNTSGGNVLLLRVLQNVSASSHPVSFLFSSGLIELGVIDGTQQADVKQWEMIKCSSSFKAKYEIFTFNDLTSILLNVCRLYHPACGWGAAKEHLVRYQWGWM